MRVSGERLGLAKHNRPFKSVVVRVTDEDRMVARAYCVHIGRKPTLRNIAQVLREWASAGIAAGMVPP